MGKGVTKGLAEWTDEGVLRWFSHVEKMEIDKFAKIVYVGECAQWVDRGRGGLIL